MRVIFDTNIVISFILTRGETIASLFSAWEDKQFILLISDDIMAEIEIVIYRFLQRKIITQEVAREILWRLKHDAIHVAITSKVIESKNHKDNRYLACAKDGKADYLTTGDTKHLLPLETFGKTRILTPKEFVKLSGVV